ncbi:MAG: type II secretion system protein [Planctomycetes bacterium]|nr:type II secretion system protein [Planctomycetota bacterium]
MNGKRRRPQRRGFSLVELSVVVIIIGVLAAFGVPRLLKSVERSKAAEAFKYCGAVRSAQERYQAREGTYTTLLTDLDVEQSAPKYFTVGVMAAGASADLEDSWTITMTRSGAASGYGAYTVTFTQDGYDPVGSTIEGIPAINPMGG